VLMIYQMTTNVQFITHSFLMKIGHMTGKNFVAI